MIKLSNITKIYNGDVCALDDVNLEFYEKEFVFIIGPSGNGKSTLLNIIGCLDFATTGEVIVNGEDVSKLTDNQLSFLRNSYFGFIFQEFYFDRNLNVLENVLVDFEKNKNTKIDNLNSLATNLGINNLLYRKVNELSGGERQRIQILRALLKNPSVILADEPTGNLDSVNKKEIYEIFKNISKDHLIIIVSHDLEAAKIYGDRILSIENGKIKSEYKNKITTYRVNNNNYNLCELTEYITNQNENQFDLKITKQVEEKSHVLLEILPYKDNKNVSSKFAYNYNKRLISNNKVNYMFSIVILSFLLSFLMSLLFFISYKSQDSINKYLDECYYQDYIFYNSVNYVNEFDEAFTNNLFTGKNLYNDISNLELEISPMTYSNLKYDNKNISSYLKYDNDINLNEVEITDYLSYRYDLKINDIIDINDKKYTITNVIDTIYPKYKDIINSTSTEYSTVKSNLIEHINYIKINYSNIKSTQISIPFSNFTITSFSKAAKTESKISNAHDINLSLEENEIVISEEFAKKNNITLSDVGKKFNFLNIRDEKYNNYYDNYVCLNDYYLNGFILKNIIEDDTSDFYVSNKIFDNLIFDYDYYYKPMFYLVEYDENIKSLTKYYISEDNIMTFYMREQSFRDMKVYIIIFLVIFLVITFLYFLVNTNQFFSFNKQNIGIFKSLGFTNGDLIKIYLSYDFNYTLSVLITSTFFYNLVYFAYELKQKDKMKINQMIQDKYYFSIYSILILYVLVALFIKYIYFKKITKEKPINLVR